MLCPSANFLTIHRSRSILTFEYFIASSVIQSAGINMRKTPQAMRLPSQEGRPFSLCKTSMGMVLFAARLFNWHGLSVLLFLNFEIQGHFSGAINARSNRKKHMEGFRICLLTIHRCLWIIHESSIDICRLFIIHQQWPDF